MIGIAGLLHQEIEGNVETENCYRIKPQFWNQGVATDAAQACKKYAENVPKKKVVIFVLMEKYPSNNTVGVHK